ncbi:MAG: tryptophan--tRNA ligase [Elusimicrobiota bacterium]|jgi:tryptophanyl-tRNA synthetase|nr:tryptophan--tRNA ligase [Elusimicrobiota bacterium]
MKKKILSAMRPTGRLHIGHYFGALKNWKKLQDEYECFYMVADLHALTTDFADTKNIAQNSLEMAADWLSVGIDPSKSVVFEQSKVSAHSELFLILSMITPLGWLYRCPTYKEQQTEIKGKDLTGYGFLGYPVLMASDILLYKADIVPVGQDQLAHLEFTREIARRFNNFYGQVFVEPEAKLTKTPKVPGIDGRKMSKSYGNSIFLAEDPESLKKKVQNMFTDPLKIKKDDPGHPDGCVVFAFYEIFNPQKALEKKEICENGKMGCAACKKEVLQYLEEFINPIARRRKELIKDKGFLEKVLEEGNEKARQAADKTMREIREALKF